MPATHADDDAKQVSAELEEAAQACDERTAPLFRRWPRLSRGELDQLSRVHRERMRIAKLLGRRRRAV